MQYVVIDLPNIGKDTFSLNISQLKNDRKLLKIYSHNIETFLNSIDDCKKSLNKILKDISKYSPMDHPFSFFKKFQIIINLQYSFLNNFLEKVQKPIEHLKERINFQFTTISEFLTNIQELAENIKLKSDFINQQNQLILSSFLEVEKDIVEYHFKINIQKKNKMNQEQLISECHKNENDYFELSNYINDMINEYKTKYNNKMKKIKNGMIELSKDTKNDVLNIIQIIKNEITDLTILDENEIKNLENFDINNPEFEPALSKYLKYQIKNDELKDLIKPHKYRINILGKNKIKVSDYLTIDVTPKDIYQIMEKLYNYNFKMIDKSEFNLETEKNKLVIIEKTGNILEFDFYKKIKIKIEKLPVEEIINFTNSLFSKEDYIIQFLKSLNYYRANGELRLSEEKYNIIKNIFCKASDYLLENNNYQIVYYLIILSQTFYKMEEGKKYLLQNEMKNKKFFLNEKFWEEYIEKIIKEELIRIEELFKNANLNDDKKKAKTYDIIFGKLISLVPSLNNFDLGKESLNSILLPIINKYNINEENKKYLFSLLDSFKK